MTTEPEELAARYAATRIESGRCAVCRDGLAVETPLHIKVNGESFATIMRTPGADEALVRGLLYTEGILSDGSAALEMDRQSDPETGYTSALLVTAPPEALAKPIAGRRSLLASASCGVCGTREPADVAVYGDAIALDAARPVSSGTLQACMARMRAGQALFDVTGGVHAAGVFDDGGGVLAVAEDIGRHNAVDKAVGRLLVEGRLGEGTVLAVSGRVSYEIVYKAYRAAIPILVAVGAASSMAVDTADRLGMTLAGFCRRDRVTVYTHVDRIANLSEAVSAEGD